MSTNYRKMTQDVVNMHRLLKAKKKKYAIGGGLDKSDYDARIEAEMSQPATSTPSGSAFNTSRSSSITTSKYTSNPDLNNTHGSLSTAQAVFTPTEQNNPASALTDADYAAAVKDTLRGKAGNGAARRKYWESKGYDYAKIQAEVNKQMRSRGTAKSSKSSSNLKVDLRQNAPSTTGTKSTTSKPTAKSTTSTSSNTDNNIRHIENRIQDNINKGNLFQSEYFVDDAGEIHMDSTKQAQRQENERKKKVTQSRQSARHIMTGTKEDNANFRKKLAPRIKTKSDKNIKNRVTYELG